jgi:2'-5' RNA ligase
MRLFLALELSGAVRGEIAALQARFRPRYEGWRWVRPEGIHLTIRFLGEVAADAYASHREGWGRAAAGCHATRFRVGGLGVFPPRGAPRVLWVGVHELAPEDGLRVMGRRFEEVARDLGFPAEDRSFRPHLTLARARGRARRPVPEPGGHDPLGEIDATRIVLFQSELSREGARYTALDAFPLRPRP